MLYPLPRNFLAIFLCVITIIVILNYSGTDDYLCNDYTFRVLLFKWAKELEKQFLEVFRR